MQTIEKLLTLAVEGTKLDCESPESRLERIIQAMLRDLLNSAHTTGQNRILQRCLARTPARLWPFAIDIIPSIRDMANRGYEDFQVTVRMIELRDAWIEGLKIGKS